MVASNVFNDRARGMLESLKERACGVQSLSGALARD